MTPRVSPQRGARRPETTIRAQPHRPDLTGRGALVTGATSGIGRATALRLAKAGASVLATGRDPHALASLAKEADGLGLALRGHPADLTDPDDRERLVEAVRDDINGLSVLVHSAGVYRRGATADAALADLDDQFAVNVQAPYALTRMLVPDLVRTHGDVVFVNSTQGLSAGAGVGQYAATKHALRAVADDLRADIGTAGVRVCSIFPGRTATPMQERTFQAEGRVWNSDLLIQPDDVADVIAMAVALPTPAEVTEILVRPARKF
jgi:NADP-dependent 3-hydroxy acid dehydrogenase YdfG